MVAQIRSVLATKFNPPLFSTRELVSGTNLPRVLRAPTREEARMARNSLGELQDQAFVEELAMNPQFYTLNEFIEMVFNPILMGFNFTEITSYLEKLNLKLVGWEMPISRDVTLRYKTDYPDDPDMMNPKYLDDFDEKNPGALRQNQIITFTCQKL